MQQAYEAWAADGDTVAQEVVYRTRNPWAVVIHAGLEDEEIWNSYPSHALAVAALKEIGQPADVMKQRPDGTLTTEF